MLKRLMLALASVAIAASCTSVSAGPRVLMDIVDRDGGRSLPQYPWRGDTWVPGAPGHRYSVRLTNTSGERVLVVLSVDGVNAVSGETASPSQAGYVLAPWESTEIAGWRKSLDDIAQFVFTDPGDSYAARTGRPHDVGVIGIAVFEEARPRYSRLAPAPIAPADAQERAAAKGPPAPAAESGYAKDAAPQSLGTGHGAREWSPVGQTRFERAGHRPVQISQLRYDDRRRLVRLGIIPPPHRDLAGPYRHAPRAFPGRFVPDPR
jgi:hypothetical protein